MLTQGGTLPEVILQRPMGRITLARGETMLAVINPTLSARVGADPVHWGNQRFETLEYTREDWALPKHQDEYNGLIKALIFYQGH